MPYEGLLGAGLFAGFAAPWLIYKNRQRANELGRFKTAFLEGATPQFIKDQNGLIIAVNSAFTDAFGLAMDDYAGLNLSQQDAIFRNPDVDFTETDKIARETGEIVYSIHELAIPKPEHSKVPNPYKAHEFLLIKRRFPIHHRFGKIEYGIIGSAKNVELVLVYINEARAKMEERQNKSPILNALNEITREMRAGFDSVNRRLAQGDSRMNEIENYIDPEKKLRESRNFDSFVTQNPDNSIETIMTSQDREVP